MSKWVLKGLRTGIVTTGYPDTVETAPGLSPGRPARRAQGRSEEHLSVISRCPTGALGQNDGRITVDYARCIHCYRCARDTSSPMEWDWGYEWAGLLGEGGDRLVMWGECFARKMGTQATTRGKVCLTATLSC
jgi:ferredoxin-like protein FixX